MSDMVIGLTPEEQRMMWWLINEALNAPAEKQKLCWSESEGRVVLKYRYESQLLLQLKSKMVAQGYHED